MTSRFFQFVGIVLLILPAPISRSGTTQAPPVVLVVAVLLAVSGCSVARGAPPSSEPPPTETTTTVAAADTTAPATVTTSAPTTTVAGVGVSTSTTQTPSVPTTTLDPSPEATAARIEQNVIALGLVTPRPGGSSAERATIDALASLVESATGLPAKVEEVPLPTGESSANVWAAPIGNGPAVLLLGAHLDTIPSSPGTDDNGSGVLVLAELLHRLAANAPENVTVEIGFFGAEEVLAGMTANDHHYGSRLDAVARAERGDLPDMMISVDMVGIGAQLLAVAYEDTDPGAVAALAAAASSVDVELTRLSRGDISDHEAFARVGVPSAMLWRPDNPNYHGPADDTFDMDLLLEDLAVLEALIASFSG